VTTKRTYITRTEPKRRFTKKIVTKKMSFMRPQPYDE
jgi:hypothetical protein